jgi:hypothetical protein
MPNGLSSEGYARVTVILVQVADALTGQLEVFGPLVLRPKKSGSELKRAKAR